MTTRKLTIMALLVGISILGANTKVLGSIALDSFPAFLGALLLGPLTGAVIGAVGHIFSATLAGFPFSVPVHLIVAAMMAVTMYTFAFAYAKLEKKGTMYAIIGSAMMGYLFNVILNLAAVYPFIGNVAFALLLPLTMATFANLFLCYVVYIRVRSFFPSVESSSL